MEEVKQKNLIVTLHRGATRSKTLELQREIYDKLNISQYPKLAFGTDMPAIEFQNFLWVMNGCEPKEFPQVMIDKVRESSKGSVDAEIICFLNSTVLPLNEDAIEFMFSNAREGKIVNFSLYDGIAFSKETYQKLDYPNMKDLFNAARKKNVPILTLRVGGVHEDNCKTYCNAEKELFWQAGETNYEQRYWDKCDDLLVRGIYEDRSIKH